VGLIAPNRKHLQVEEFKEEYKVLMKVNKQNQKIIKHLQKQEAQTP